MEKIVPAAHAHHGCSTAFALGVRIPRLAWDMGHVLGMLGIGDVDERSPVGLHLAGEGVKLLATMVADVRDPARALLLDNRLIGAAGLQVVVTHQVHIAGPGCSLLWLWWQWLLSGHRRREKTGKRPSEHKPS